jgi:hypothetical protein
MSFLNWFGTPRNRAAAKRAARLQARLGVQALGERIAPSAGHFAAFSPHIVHAHVAASATLSESGSTDGSFTCGQSSSDSGSSSTSATASTATTSTATATHFLVLAQPGYAGEPDKIVVEALDASNHVVRNYAGTVHLTSTDTNDTLPADYTFTASDRGVHAFTVTTADAGTDTVTATDAATSSITGSVAVNVGAAQVATHFMVLAVPSHGSCDGSSSSS